MNKIIVVGAGGHAKVVIEIFRAMGVEIAYCVGANDSSDLCLGVPVLKGDEHLKALKEKGYSKAFVAIGSNKIRTKIAKVATNLGYELVNAISPSSIISPTARLGCGIAIMSGVVINADTTIGDLAIVNTGATIDHDCQIGEAVHVAPQCGLAGNVSVGKNCFIGIGTIVIPEISIGQNVMTGAGCVVTKSLPENVLALGVPARIVKK